MHEDLDLGKRIAKEDRRIRGEPTPSKSSQLSSAAKQTSLIKSNEVKDASPAIIQDQVHDCDEIPLRPKSRTLVSKVLDFEQQP